MKIKQHPNLSAYDNVESLNNFTQEGLFRYFEEKLESTSKHISFLRKYCIDTFWKGRVCEIGSGNSKLLYRLEKEKLLNEGIGIEISKSRFKFAEELKFYVNSHKVTNLNKNVLEISPFVNLDLIVGVDIVLQLISPLNKNAETIIFDWMRKSLRPNGFVVLELWDFEHILKQIDITQNNLKIWEAFSENDPFEFVLAHISLNKENDIVWEKLFLKRDSNEKSKFENILRPYSPKKIISIFKQNGFKSVDIFTKWNKGGDVSQGEYIVLAQRI